MPNRCVLRCKPTVLPLHTFPDPEKFPERFKRWVTILDERNRNLGPALIKKRLRLCNAHFLEKHHNRWKRLNALAVPYRDLATDKIEENVVYDDDSKKDDLEIFTEITKKAVVKKESDDSDDSDDSNDCDDSDRASPELADGDTVIYAVDDEPLAPEEVEKENEEVIADPAEQLKTLEPGYFAFSALNPNTVIHIPRTDHNYCVDQRKYKPNRDEFNVELSKHYHTQYLLLRKKARSQAAQIYMLRRKIKFLSTLKGQNRLTNERAFNHLTRYMKPAAKVFLGIQLGHKKRIFNNEQKDLALSLYNKSPECYKLMCELFTMPTVMAVRRFAKMKEKAAQNDILKAAIENVMIFEN